jgi:hypothetical protein
VEGGTGTVSANVSNIKVTCVTNKYPVTVNVTGLEGDGLVLQNNAGNDLSVAKASPVGPVKASFTTTIASGAAYAVTVKSQPKTPAQICTVSGGTGTVVAGEVTVTVNCTNAYTIGGTVSGLAGKGFTLQNNAGDDLAVNANGAFSFVTPLVTGAPYAATIKAQPTDPWQTCTVTSGTGNATANVTSIAVTCTTNKYKVQGTIAGYSGSGLVIQNNGADDLSPASGAQTFDFATSLESGSMSTVTVKTQPTAPWQTCLVANGGPTKIANANITNVALTCTVNKYTVSAKVLGLQGQGLVLQNNAGDDLTFNQPATTGFGNTIASGANYAVTVKTQPNGVANEFCTVAAPASGTVAGANVEVTVRCGVRTLVGTRSGVAFYSVPVVGIMSDPNARAACEAVGLIVPCQAQAGCQYNGPGGVANQCKITPAETSCSNPMLGLSQTLCNGNSPSNCPALLGTYQYMGESWGNGGSNGTCGAEQGNWCTTGSTQSNKKVLCVVP